MGKCKQGCFIYEILQKVIKCYREQKWGEETEENV